MNRKEMRDYYDKYGPIKGQEWRKPDNKKLLQNLKEEFPFVEELKGRVYPSVYIEALYKDLTVPPSCESCGNEVESIVNGNFARFCSKKCMGAYYKTTNIPFSEEVSGILTDPVKLEKEYKKHGSFKLADLLGVTVKTVFNHMERNNIPRTGNEERIGGELKAIVESKDTLKRYYYKFGVPYLSKKCNCSQSFIYDKLNEYGISLTNGVDTEIYNILDDKDKLFEYYNSLGIRGTSEILGVCEETLRKYIDYHQIKRKDNQSHLELTFKSFLDELQVDYLQNDRQALSGMEIDFFLPEYGIGIEMNGLYWHSSKFRDKDYHLKKTEEAIKNGIKLFHIYEDEWNERREQWKEKIRTVLGMSSTVKVGARETKFKVTSSKNLKCFMENHHIQGFSGGFLSVSLTKDDETVGSAIFRKDPSESKTVQLNRYATSVNLIGGLSKIMKNTIPILKNMGYESIVSFADRGYSDGNLYEATGWLYEGITNPDYRYVINNKRHRKQNFRLSKLPKVLGEQFDENISERENMEKAGIPRIYDCGLIKYRFNI